VAGPRSDHRLKQPGRFTSIELDPDYDVFRHLYPQEIEPILAAVYGSPEKHFISYTSNESINSSFELFGANMTESKVNIEDATVLVAREGEFAAILLNPEELPPSLKDLVQITADEISVKGEPFSRNNSFFFAVEEPELFARMLVVLSRDLESLPRLGAKLPHYGKYSYLVFEGTRNVGKGQWPSRPSPLRQSL
jgi:hypothetical protein